MINPLGTFRVCSTPVNLVTPLLDKMAVTGLVKSMVKSRDAETGR